MTNEERQLHIDRLRMAEHFASSVDLSEALTAAISAHLGECVSCGESPSPLCSESKRGCGHHCNCSWVHDKCCWCGVEFGEDAQASTSAQSSPDLESVRRLIRAAELMHEKQSYEEAVSWDREIAKYAEESLPALRHLLSEIEYVNSESVQLQIKELNEGWAASLAEVKKLREENARMKAAITKAAEEGLSHEV